MISRRAVLRLSAAVLAGLSAAGAFGVPAVDAAEALRPVPAVLPPLPAGPVMLTVDTPAGPRGFTLAEVEAIGLRALTLDLVWTGEGGVYHGVLLPDLLAATGLQDAPAVEVHAIDGYHATIPRHDWQTWPILLATRRDGQPMAVRDKGPMRILYAMTPEQVLASDKMDVRWVWMVDRITVAAQGAGDPS